MDWVTFGVLNEELGRGCSSLRSLLTVHSMAAFAVLRWGSRAQKERWLGPFARGEAIGAFALSEPEVGSDASAVQATATRDGDEYVLHGRKKWTTYGQVADVFLLFAKEDGKPVAFLVERGAPGLTVTPMLSLDQTRRIAEVEFENTPAQLLGTPEAGWATWTTVRNHALVHLAGEALGGAQKVLEDSVKYAKERVQFGKPIGVNQAIKHKCADMLIQVESSKSITYYAAWAVAENIEEAELAASMAKAYTSDAYRATSAENIQIHGGVGFTWEYDCHLYFKRAKALEVTYGDPAEHRERVAQLLKL
jgi:alkylation response protein AidB-like acyl-CoA dehydrogenase